MIDTETLPLSAIPPVTAVDPEARSADPVAANVEALKALFPDAFVEGQIDFDVLRQLLGDAVDEGEEKYGLNWSGKHQARRLALMPSLGTLRPAPEDSVDWDNTRNLMIEGDNLEVLKLLQKSYAGRVKLIYIDPPYNTGNDFVYPDDFSDSIGNYLRRTNQVDVAGARITSNSESSGRYHTDWLNMMYPRLMIARNLLTEDGVIFISIDDAEVSNLKSMAGNIFGDENYLATFVRRRRMATGMRNTTLSPDHEYVVTYAKSADSAKLYGFARLSSDFPFSDDISQYRSTDLTVGMGRALRPNQFYAITNPKTGTTYLPSEDRVWRFEPGSMEGHIAAQNIIWPEDNPSGRMSRPRFKTRWSEGEDTTNPVSTWITSRPEGSEKGLNAGLNEEATKEVRTLMGDQVFDYPKPLSLVQGLTAVGSQKDDIVLDFFAGSGTTGHAVMAQNAADGGIRRYVLVQLPELLDPTKNDQKSAAAFCDSLDKPRNISELTKERLRRAAAKIKADHPDTAADLGFRVYKLATSNLKAWAPGGDLEADLVSAIDNVVDGRSEHDLLVELLLKQGIDLTEPVATRMIAKRQVHAFGGGVLLVCLGSVTAADAEPLADGIVDWIGTLSPAAPTTVFFMDSGFENDQAKTNVAAILEQRLGDQLLKVRSV
jgi:adenine-specific DNA-methyltransferase